MGVPPARAVQWERLRWFSGLVASTWLRAKPACQKLQVSTGGNGHSFWGVKNGQAGARGRGKLETKYIVFLRK